MGRETNNASMIGLTGDHNVGSSSFDGATTANSGSKIIFKSLESASQHLYVYAVRAFENERDGVVNALPSLYKSRWGTWSFVIEEDADGTTSSCRPCYVLSPYDVPPGPHRTSWMVWFEQLQDDGCLERMPHLICYYQTPDCADDLVYEVVPSERITDGAVQRQAAKHFSAPVLPPVVEFHELFLREASRPTWQQSPMGLPVTRITRESLSMGMANNDRRHVAEQPRAVNDNEPEMIELSSSDEDFVDPVVESEGPRSRSSSARKRKRPSRRDEGCERVGISSVHDHGMAGASAPSVLEIATTDGATAVGTGSVSDAVESLFDATLSCGDAACDGVAKLCPPSEEQVLSDSDQVSPLRAATESDDHSRDTLRASSVATVTDLEASSAKILERLPPSYTSKFQLTGIDKMNMSHIKVVSPFDPHFDQGIRNLWLEHLEDENVNNLMYCVRRVAFDATRRLRVTFELLDPNAFMQFRKNQRPEGDTSSLVSWAAAV